MDDGIREVAGEPDESLASAVAALLAPGEPLPPPPAVEDTLYPQEPIDLRHFDACLEYLQAIREVTLLPALLDGTPFGEASTAVPAAFYCF